MNHPTAEVLSDNIGKGTDIWQFCVVLPGAIIGTNCNINCHVFIENDVIIGDDVTIKSGVQIWDGLRIASKVFIGPNATFTNEIVPRSKQYPVKFVKTIIEEGASIGANATIIAGNIIGEYAMIGAGSLVSRDVPPFSLWYGNPAKHMGYITKEGIVLDLSYKDKKGKQYVLVNSEPVLK